MKTLILYYSQCGHTKRYAEDLHVRIGGDLKEAKTISRRMLKEYDTIFFGGPLRGNTILKLKNLMKHYNLIKDKNIFIFADGLSTISANNDTKDLVITTNDLDEKHVRLYLLPGGLDLQLMKPLKRKFFRFLINVVGKKEDVPGSANLKMIIDHPIDMVNPAHLDRMVTVYNKISRGF
ncbi:MAG: flavodoxin domain-containing protein [Bacilli bacterium]